MNSASHRVTFPCPAITLLHSTLRLSELVTRPTVPFTVAAPRIIPLGGPGGDLHDMLVEQQKRHAAVCPDSPWVFFRQGSKHMDRKSTRRGRRVDDIRKGWAKTAEATGIHRLFHDLQRTGVRNLFRAGAPQKVAMMISGHKTTSMFSRYNIVDERDLHDAADKLAKYLNVKTENGQN